MMEEFVTFTQYPNLLYELATSLCRRSCDWNILNRRSNRCCSRLLRHHELNSIEPPLQWSSLLSHLCLKSSSSDGVCLLYWEGFLGLPCHRVRNFNVKIIFAVFRFLLATGCCRVTFNRLILESKSLETLIICLYSFDRRSSWSRRC